MYFPTFQLCFFLTLFWALPFQKDHKASRPTIPVLSLWFSHWRTRGKKVPICHLDSISNYFGWALKLRCHISITQEWADICFLPAAAHTDSENYFSECSCRKYNIGLCRELGLRKAVCSKWELGLQGVRGSLLPSPCGVSLARLSQCAAQQRERFLFLWQS